MEAFFKTEDLDFLTKETLKGSVILVFDFDFRHDDEVCFRSRTSLRSRSLTFRQMKRDPPAIKSHHIYQVKKAVREEFLKQARKRFMPWTHDRMPESRTFWEYWEDTCDVQPLYTLCREGS